MRKYVGAVGLLALGFSLGAPQFPYGTAPARAQAVPQGRVGVRTEATDAALDGDPVMISIVRGSDVVAQMEAKVGKYHTLGPLPVGLYDVRVEGDGIKTLVKRGVHVLNKQDAQILVPLAAGQGVRIVEYAVAGLPREEVADRLMKLEAAVADLQKLLKDKPKVAASAPHRRDEPDR